MTHIYQSIIQCFHIQYSHLYLCVFAGCLIYFLDGYQWGYLSPALVKLSENGYYEIPPLSSFAQSWMVTWCIIGHTPGAVCASYVADLFGRKYCLIFTIIPSLLAHFCTYFAMNVNMFYLSQFLRGFSSGWAFVNIPIYLSEITPPKLRGSFSALSVVFMTIGSKCVSNTIQSIESIETTALIGIIITIIILPLLFIITESPYYYLMKNNEHKCLHGLRKLRGTPNVDKEFDEMKITFVENVENKKSSSWVQLFSVSSNLRVSLITGVAATVLQFSGQIPLSNYAHTIIYNSSLYLSLLTISLMIGASHFLGNFLAIFAIEYLGRKPLFIFVCILSAIGHVSIGFSLFIMDNFNTNQSKLLGMFTVIGVLLFEFAKGFGFSQLPPSLAAELYPTSMKSIGLSFIKFLSAMEGIAVVQIFELLTNISYFIPFFCMAGASLIGVGFGIIFIPETKSKSLAKIQEYLNSK